jgi:hypothetical protein
MPRPRKNDPTTLIRPLIQEFAAEIAVAVEKMTIDRVRAVLDSTRGGGAHKAGARALGPRGKTLCYYPGCKNVAAPRFGMFCAALHKNLSAAEKDKYRKQHTGGGAAKPAAGKKKGRRGSRR